MNEASRWRLALDRGELPGLYDLLCGMVRNLLALLAAVDTSRSREILALELHPSPAPEQPLG